MTSTIPKTSNISIIIPALNEEGNIPALAENLGAGHEIILVDGGSDDRTVELANHYGFKVIKSGSGRGHQQNLGATEARGEILLFLHADTRLPENFAAAVQQTLQRPDCIAGAFKLAIANPTAGMRLVTACANIRSRYLQLPYGDQAIFIQKRKFFDLQMFPEIPIMEDYVFVRQARKHGRIYTLDEKVQTSARRWRKLGVIRTTLINQLILLGFFCKVPLKSLVSLYRR